ncbi:MAG: arginase family protein [Bacteroidetes bacterium]|nr:arginase family protein [Bacteroidota bacterium]
MNFNDFIIPPPTIEVEPWQLGSLLTQDIEAGTIVLIFVSDYRGAGYSAESILFSGLRKKLYRLSKSDFHTKICDLGDLVSCKTLQDTHYFLQETLLTCHQLKAIPIVIGGGNDISYSLFNALHAENKTINFTQISPMISLSDEGEEISDANFLAKILGIPDFSIGQYNFLGLQRHAQDKEAMRLLKDVDFEVVPLSKMMDTTSSVEPYFRKADLVTLNCDAVESFAEPFSLHPQVNGLNRREICAYMKEIGLSGQLKSVGIFNFNFYEKSYLNQQLLSQMLWYLLEGINIQMTHPKNNPLEQYVVVLGYQTYTFQRDVFKDLWYFGEGDVAQCKPCSKEDYEQAKKGFLNQRFL